MQKRSRKLNKKEIIALVIVLAAIALGVGMREWSFQKREADQLAFEQSESKVYSMGETVRLDPEQDEATVSAGGLSYSARFTFTGCIDATVKGAWLYDSPEAAGIDETQLLLPEIPNDLFFLVEVTLKTIDAEPDAPSHSGKNWFNASFIKLSQGGDLAYFSGTPPNANPSEGYCFEQSSNEEKTYRLGWSISRDDPDELLGNKVVYGVTNHVIDKYAVELDIQDMRGGNPA